MQSPYTTRHHEPIRIADSGTHLTDRELTKTCQMIDRAYARLAIKYGWDRGGWGQRNSNHRLFNRKATKA